MKPGAATNRKQRQADRQAGHDVARQALLRGQGPDLALDADAFADRVGDRIEDLGEVATDLVLDADGGRHQLEVVRADAADHVLEGLVEGQAEVDLADDPTEFGRDRRAGLAHDELDRLQERRTGAQGVGDEGDRVGQLLVEGAEPATLAARQPEARQQEADQRADQQEERVPQGRQEGRQEEHRDRDADDRRGPDHEELGRLELEVGSRDVTREVRAEVALLDDPVQAVEGLALGDQLG